MPHQIINDETLWDSALTSLPHPHVLQSWAWGQFKSRWGWQPTRLLWSRQNQPIAAAQILSRAIPYTPWNFLYAAKGPIFADQNLTTIAQVLVALEQYARQQNALFIKIDPDIIVAHGEDGLPNQQGQAVQQLLKQRGWQFSAEQIQFRNTVLINLQPDEATLLADMKSKWRYNIRLAARKGVTIQSGTVDDIARFYQMYHETAQRDGFLIRPEAYYQDVWSTFMGNHQAEMLLAVVEEQVVAGLMLFFYGPTAWYLYGASTGQHRKLMPNHLLQWTAMQRAKSRGCTNYDLWGAPNQFDDSDSMWGVYRFKQGFNGQVIHGLGAWDYPVKPSLYWAFMTALPKLRSLWRKWR